MRKTKTLKGQVIWRPQKTHLNILSYFLILTTVEYIMIWKRGRLRGGREEKNEVLLNIINNSQCLSLGEMDWGGWVAVYTHNWCWQIYLMEHKEEAKSKTAAHAFSWSTCPECNEFREASHAFWGWPGFHGTCWLHAMDTFIKPKYFTCLFIVSQLIFPKSILTATLYCSF